MSSDATLLRQYAENNDQSAFTELVQRHLGLVYHAALRQLEGDAHRAEEVAQFVFADLARKARTLSRREVLASWLYTSTRFAVGNVMRSELRRKRYEQEAARMSITVSTVPWEKLKPLIDEAAHDLSEKDRAAVVLRYFEGQPFAAVGTAIGASEDAARVRVDRALSKLQQILARRGITSSTAALATVLGAEAIGAPPTGLAATVTQGALAAGLSMTGAAAGWLGSGVTTALAATTAVALTVLNLVEYRQTANLRAELRHLQDESRTLVRASLRGAAMPNLTTSPGLSKPRAMPGDGRLFVRGRELRPDMSPVEQAELLYPDGRSTPMRTWQTMLNVGRDQDNDPRRAAHRAIMSLLFCFDQEAEAKVRAFLMALPRSTHGKPDTAEALVAPVFDRWLWRGDRPRGYSPRGDRPADGDATRATSRFEITRESGATETVAYPFKRFADGWRYGPLTVGQTDELLALLDPVTGEPKP